MIKISDETEAELRKVFGSKPSYKDSALRVFINKGVTLPITIRVAGDCTGGKDFITRTVKGTEAFIVALQGVVAYCKQNNIG